VLIIDYSDVIVNYPFIVLADLGSKSLELNFSMDLVIQDYLKIFHEIASLFQYNDLEFSLQKQIQNIQDLNAQLCSLRRQVVLTPFS
jgi:hypothetical protein